MLRSVDFTEGVVDLLGDVLVDGGHEDGDGAVGRELHVQEPHAHARGLGSILALFSDGRKERYCYFIGFSPHFQTF